VISGLAAAVLSVIAFVFRDAALARLMHAQGPAAEVASGILAITIPANVPMAVGMALSGVLRAAGDARRAMYVTLGGGLVTLFTDPMLIFGFGLGVYGAAWATVISRLVFLAVGLHGAVRIHDLVGAPSLAGARRDFRSIMGIGLPAILANLATPVAAVYVTRVWSDFGQATVSGGAIVDRVIPLAFGVIFALTGSIGPIRSCSRWATPCAPGRCSPWARPGSRRCSTPTATARISCCCSAATARSPGCS
jgi:Na+-driven multidrug efflux pump